ncbi:MAG: DUF1972 domain-containing protein [Clostridiales bacterium]
MKHIFIIGSKGIPAKYGGFETFVHKLVEKQCNKDIHYHIACIGENNDEYVFNGASCFKVKLPKIGRAKAILYDLLSLRRCIKYIEKNKFKDSIIYILACRIGPFMFLFKNRFNRNGIKVYVNPDGNEWNRKKWNYCIRKYWKYSERLMVKNSNLLICDSKVIENYIKKEYKVYSPDTVYISYGADIRKPLLEDTDTKLINWYAKNDLKKNEYYLMVGRFVPENNYELIIREYMKTDAKKDLVIITNCEINKYYLKLLKHTEFNRDKRIKFVGTMYDQEVMKKIRENAFGYVHGHEVGGTNPSLLEALSMTILNIVFEVAFNREVCKDSVIYFSKSNNSFSNRIKEVEKLSENQIEYYGEMAKKRIIDSYSWTTIINKYESVFLK